jgi:AbrB family looped-hinge helix DNA binding protein
MKSHYFGMKSVVSKKGQVTIPKACRDRLGLEAGTTLQYETRDGKPIAVIQPPEDVLPSGKGGGGCRAILV